MTVDWLALGLVVAIWRVTRLLVVDEFPPIVFAPPSDHVNIHEHVLHLWGRLDGKPALPDFTDGTGSI